MKITIITINLNNKNGLKKTLASIISQTYSNIQHVVIDGGSNDGSIDIIEENKNYLSYWISEKDLGAYHAMNKGINQAKGDYCLFLNSGDYLYDNATIQNAVDFISQDSQNVDIVYGDLLFNNHYAHSPKQIDLNFLSAASLPHPATFIASKLFDPKKVGLYSENYMVISDWLFFLKAYLIQLTFKHINIPIAIFEGNGISGNYDLINEEKRDALDRYFPNLIHDFEILEEFRKYNYSRMHKLTSKIAVILKNIYN